MSIAGKLDLEGINLTFDPDIYPTTQCKTIGMKWKSPVWTTSFSLTVYYQLLDLFPQWEFECSQNLQDHLANITCLPEVSFSHDSLSKLKDYQREGSSFLLHHKRVLLALAPRLGKSIVSLASASLLEGFVLIVCPLTLTYTWKNTIREWLGEESTIWHGKSSTWKSPSSRWIITNYETVSRHMVEFNQHKNPQLKFDLSKLETLIVDESFMVKNRKAIRSKAIAKIASSIPYVWLLSGSPIGKFYDDLYQQLHIVRPKTFSSYWRFVDQYCIAIDNGWGMSIVGNKPDATEKLTLHLSDVMMARTQDQVLDLPEWNEENIQIPMTSYQYKIYKQMEEEFLAYLPEAGETLMAINTLARLTRLIQIASNPLLVGDKNSSGKWNSLKEILSYAPQPAIIWISYKKTASFLKEFLLSQKLRVEVLTGDTPADQRTPIVDKFQNGDLDVMIAHPGVGKYGLTLTAGRTSIYLERDWNSDNYIQSRFRIRDIHTKEEPNIFHLLSTDPDGRKTVDGVIDQVLRFRQKSSEEITTGRLLEMWRD